MSRHCDALTETKLVREFQGLQFKEVRVRLGLSQTDFSHLFGTQQKTVSHWEHGRGSIPFEYLAQLLKHPLEMFRALQRDAELRSPFALLPLNGSDLKDGAFGVDLQRREGEVDRFMQGILSPQSSRKSGFREPKFDLLGWTQSKNPFRRISCLDNLEDIRLLSDDLEAHGARFVASLRAGILDSQKRHPAKQTRLSLLQRYCRMLERSLFRLAPELRDVWGDVPAFFALLNASTQAQREAISAMVLDFQSKRERAKEKIGRSDAAKTRARIDLELDERYERASALLSASNPSNLEEVVAATIQPLLGIGETSEARYRRKRNLAHLRTLAERHPKLRSSSRYGKLYDWFKGEENVQKG